MYEDLLQPVSEKKPNGFCLYDMHGDGWEWCQDAVRDSRNGAPDHWTAGTTAGSQSSPVPHGGSWSSDAFILRSAKRAWLAFPRPYGNDMGGSY